MNQGEEDWWLVQCVHLQRVSESLATSEASLIHRSLIRDPYAVDVHPCGRKPNPDREQGMSAVVSLQTEQSRKPEHQQNRKELIMHQVAGLVDPRMFDNTGLSLLLKSPQSIMALGKAVR